MRRRSRPFVLLAVLPLISAVGCVEEEPEPMQQGPAAAEQPQADASLYERLGGEAAIRSVIDDLVARASADEELNFTRQGTAEEWEATPENVEELKQRLVEFVGSATGGPQTYQGEDMRTAHAGMEVTNEEFDRLGEHLRAALEANGVTAALQQELMAIVESTRPQIVTPEA